MLGERAWWRAALAGALWGALGAMAGFRDEHWTPLGGPIRPDINGPVNGVAVAADGTVFIGGSFTLIGNESVSRVARWEGGRWQPLGSGVNGEIRAVALDGQGRLLVGGALTSAGGVSANGIARWNGAMWEALGAGVSGAVHAIAVDGLGRVFAAHGTPASVSMWNGVAWTTIGTAGAEVWALVVAADGTLYAGGAFTNIGGVAAARVARWNGTSWSSLGSGMNGPVRALVLDTNGHLVAGGEFTSAGGAAANRVARWNQTGWSAIGGGAPATVRAVAVGLDGRLWLGGGMAPGSGVIAVWDGVQWNTVAQCDDPVHALAVCPLTGRLHAAGPFRSADGVFMPHVMVRNGTDWVPFGTGFDGPVLTLVTDPVSLDVFAGGGFQVLDERRVRHVAKWSGGVWSPVGEGFDGWVYALAMGADRRLYAGGDFLASGTASVNRVAVLEGGGWRALGSGMNGAVYALAVPATNRLYAGGVFTTAGGTNAARVAEWDGTRWRPLGTGMNGPVYTLFVDDNGDLYAGGSFTTAGGTAANRIARWNGVQWAPVGGGLDGEVWAIERAPGGGLVVAGKFSQAGGQPAERVALWRDGVWQALGAGIEGDGVFALRRCPSGALYAGGQFSEAGGVPANNIARWDGLQWSGRGSGVQDEAPFGAPDFTALYVYALASDGNGGILVGGAFGLAGGRPSAYLAKLASFFDIAASPNDSNAGSVAGAGRYLPGDTVQLNATPSYGYHFRRWTENGAAVATNPVIAFEADRHRTLIALFGTNVYVVRYGVSVSGSISGVATQSIPHATTGTPVLAVAPAGAQFHRWSDGRVDNPRRDGPVTNSFQVLAEFHTARQVPLEWFAQHGLLPTPPQTWTELEGEDSDGDGDANWAEFIADTSPTNAQSAIPRLQISRAPVGWRLSLNPTSLQRRYHLELCVSLAAASWTAQTNRPGTGGEWVVEVPENVGAPLFFRIRVTLP
ncbi:MAG: hypothetical protein N2652_06515 [Kiritimatiellae bacterium]|nr:hypothetical protein [Kiritimatiellia bacterium]